MMAPPTHTFPCPFCGRRMGVRTEMLGRKVRCPHCSQVVLAPGAAGSASSEASPSADISRSSTESKSASGEPAKRYGFSGTTPKAAPTPLPPADPPQPVSSPTQVADEPNYSFDRQREAADSILSSSDESDDEVFSSQTQNKVPVLPKLDPDTAPPQSIDTGTAPVGASASKIPTLELLRPVEIIPAPISASALLPPPPVESPPNPFAFEPPSPQPPLAASPTPPTRDAIPVPAILQPQANTGPLASDRSDTAPDAKASKGRYLVYGLAVYAAIATILAIYTLFFRSSPKLDPGHPLSTIPDSFGEFDPASRKKVSQLKIDFNAPLPAGQKVGIGQTIEVGQLQVEPLRVKKRPLRIVREGKAAGDVTRSPQPTRFPALVLHLRIKNLSTDTPIFPLDPAFTRAASVEDRPAMRLAIGKHVLYGGAIAWPFAERMKREYEEGQERDYVPLKPGESREYIVFTNEDSTLTTTIKKATDPLQWRVQVRRGSIEFKGKNVPVTAIIGVEFTPSEIQNLD